MVARPDVILVSVVATSVVIAILQQTLGFPPLILFAAPIAAGLRAGGAGAALTIAASAAVIGDYFFVEPVHELTLLAQGLRLLVVLFAGTMFAIFLLGPVPRRKP